MKRKRHTHIFLLWNRVMQVHRSWGRSTPRKLILSAQYWIVNKSGLALCYRAKLSKQQRKQSANGNSGADSAVATSQPGATHASVGETVSLAQQQKGQQNTSAAAGQLSLLSNKRSKRLCFSPLVEA